LRDPAHKSIVELARFSLVKERFRGEIHKYPNSCFSGFLIRRPKVRVLPGAQPQNALLERGRIKKRIASPPALLSWQASQRHPIHLAKQPL
jgi:hypothetical protein